MKSCACLDQLARFAYDGHQGYASSSLSTVAFGDKGKAFKLCYERKGLPESQQFSDPPETDDPNITWKIPIDLIKGEYKQAQAIDVDVDYVREQKPLSQCPDRCSERGGCDSNSQCRCLPGFEGLSCQKVASSLAHSHLSPCPNHCGYKGLCFNGFCHCEQGFWGIDCTRSKAYEAEAGNRMEEEGRSYSRTQLKIYRYEMPMSQAPFQRDSDWYRGDLVFQGYNPLYSAFDYFFERFSNDSIVRTENPYEANMFYVPLFVHLSSGNGDVYSFTRRALDYVKRTYPKLWERNAGRDHFIWLPGDLGGCWIPLDDPMVQNPIRITHWGFEVPGDSAQASKCFKAERDIVAVPWTGAGPWQLQNERVEDSKSHIEESSARGVYARALSNKTSRGSKRPYLLFFGGSIFHHWMEYSGGARQAFDKHVLNKSHPDISYGGKYGDSEGYRSATFCFCPYGHGWGNRVVHAIHGGCIPIVVQDHVYLPYEDVLDYTLFSMRFRVEDIPLMVDVLRRVSPVEVQRYRAEMFKVHQAFSWPKSLGGQAYDITIRSLQKRLFNLWGMHYSLSR